MNPSPILITTLVLGSFWSFIFPLTPPLHAGGNFSVGDVILDPQPTIEKPVFNPNYKQSGSLASGNTRVTIFVIRDSQVAWFEEKEIKVLVDGEFIGRNDAFRKERIDRKWYDRVDFYLDLPSGEHDIEAQYSIRMRGTDSLEKANWKGVNGPKKGDLLILECYSKVNKNLFNSRTYQDLRKPITSQLPTPLE